MSLLDRIVADASTQYAAYAAANPDDRFVGELVLLYGQQSIEERNATFEVAAYLPDWFAIGDDSGGMALLMRLNGSHAVFQCDHGALGSCEPDPVAPFFADWLRDGCLLPDDEPASELPLWGDLWLVDRPAGGLKDLMALKNLLRLDTSLGAMKEHLDTIPCVIVRDVPCIALAMRVASQSRLAACVSFSDPGGTRPQYRVS